MLTILYRKQIAGAATGVVLGAFLNGLVLQRVLNLYSGLNNLNLDVMPVSGVKMDAVWVSFYQVSMWFVVVLSILGLWRYFRMHNATLASVIFEGPVLIGAGVFTVADAVIMHLVLNLQHIKPGAPGWDLGYLVYGVVLLTIGVISLREIQVSSGVSTTADQISA